MGRVENMSREFHALIMTHFLMRQKGDYPKSRAQKPEIGLSGTYIP